MEGLSLSANVAFTSDYRFRGVSFSEGDFAIQGGFDIARPLTFDQNRAYQITHPYAVRRAYSTLRKQEFSKEEVKKVQRTTTEGAEAWKNFCRALTYPACSTAVMPTASTQAPKWPPRRYLALCLCRWLA